MWYLKACFLLLNLEENTLVLEGRLNFLNDLVGAISHCEFTLFSTSFFFL